MKKVLNVQASLSMSILSVLDNTFFPENKIYKLVCIKNHKTGPDPPPTIVSSPDPTYERGSGDIWLIPRASLMLITF